MKKVSFLFVSLVICCLISCDLGKTHFTDLDFRRDHGNEYAYKKDGTVFTGTAWSSDDKTLKIEVNNGVITTVTLFHSNGNVASTGSKNNLSYYDTNGNVITEQQFEKNYPELMVQVGAFEHEVHYIEK